MKKMDELMKELGFDAKASDAVKKAFIKNLLKTVNHQENGADLLNLRPVLAGQHISVKTEVENKKSRVGQLSFALDDDKKLA